MTKSLQKLELTWIGKGEEPKLEPRILIENPEYSYGDPDSENMLIHGDNLLALKALEQFYSGEVKCVCIDPPYNTGSRIDSDGKEVGYEDGVEHSLWLNLMNVRLKILRGLLSKEGSIWIYIDDNELYHLKVLCDEIFGRDNFVSTICVKMSHLSGVKMSHINKKPPKIKEFILIYSKDKNYFNLNPAFEQVSWNESLERYNQFILNIEDDMSQWKVKPVKQVAKEKGVNVKDTDQYEKFLIKNANSIFRTARNRALEQTGIKGEFKSIISKTGLSKLVYNDEEVLFASEKLIDVNGELIPANPIGDIWLDIGINNLHNEGNVDFRNGKKPEKAIHRIISMASNPGDLVLDSFLGSGTTAAVAHKMGRRWIGVELGEHAKTHCYPRLKAVVNGEQAGISKASKWQGGGGFKFFTLAPSLLRQDKFGNWVISQDYNADMLAAAMAKHEGFRYQPHESTYWKQGQSSEQDFIFTTTTYTTRDILESIATDMLPEESLLICCTQYEAGLENAYPNINLRKIPSVLLNRCEFKEDSDYSLHIIESPLDDLRPEQEETIFVPEPQKLPNTTPMPDLFNQPNY